MSRKWTQILVLVKLYLMIMIDMALKSNIDLT